MTPSDRSPKWLKKCRETPDVRLPTLKTSVIEFIAEMYSATANDVTKDIRSLEGAEEALNQLCERSHHA